MDSGGNCCGTNSSKISTVTDSTSKNSQPSQQKTPFETQKEDLLNTILSVHHSALSKDQTVFLSKLGITSLIGQVGADAIEAILFRNGIDVATAATKIAEHTKTLNEGIRKSGLIAEGLEGCIEINNEEVVDGVLIRVSFLGDASMANVVDFRKWGIIWHDIGRGVAQAHNCAPEDIKIIGAAKGSVIIELQAAALIAGTVSGIILSALKVAEKVLDLKKKAAEIRILELQEKKLAGEIEKAAEKEKTAGIKKIITGQIKELKLNKTSDGDKITALEKAIKDLVDFVEDGGEVDFIAPEEDVDEEGEVIPDDFTLVREQAENIRQLEDHLRLIEDNSGESI